MSLNAGWVELNDALKNLRALFEETREVWDDGVARDFEEKFWQPLDSQAKAALQAIDRLAPVLARARRECKADADDPL
jgi:hypothetical protein